MIIMLCMKNVWKRIKLYQMNYVLLILVNLKFIHLFYLTVHHLCLIRRQNLYINYSLHNFLVLIIQYSHVSKYEFYESTIKIAATIPVWNKINSNFYHTSNPNRTKEIEKVGKRKKGKKLNLATHFFYPKVEWWNLSYQSCICIKVLVERCCNICLDNCLYI